MKSITFIFLFLISLSVLGKPIKQDIDLPNSCTYPLVNKFFTKSTEVDDQEMNSFHLQLCKREINQKDKTEVEKIKKEISELLKINDLLLEFNHLSPKFKKNTYHNIEKRINEIKSIDNKIKIEYLKNLNDFLNNQLMVNEYKLKFNLHVSEQKLCQWSNYQDICFFMVNSPIDKFYDEFENLVDYRNYFLTEVIPKTQADEMKIMQNRYRLFLKNFLQKIIE